LTREELELRVGSVGPWFHSIDLPSGVVTPGQGSQAYIKDTSDIYFSMGIEGRSVLDVGAWDGAFSFEAERRGAADILAVDDLAWRPATWTSGKVGFDLCHEALASAVRSRQLDLPQVTLESVGQFDIVLYNGIVYHVLDPIRDLIEMSRIARYVLTVETYIDNLDYPRPVMNFFPGEKMPAGLPQNGWGPNSLLMHALLAKLGFETVLEWPTPLQGTYRSIFIGFKPHHPFEDFVQRNRDRARPRFPAKEALDLPQSLPRRLNVGCGYDKRPGFLNVDLHAIHEPDLVADVTSMPMLPGGYFHEIVAQDVLEHFERGKTAGALAEWARLLAPEGTLFVRVPSLLHLMEMLAAPANRDAEAARKIVHLMYGTQAYTGDYHLAGFTATILEQFLADAGLLVCEAQILHGWLFEVTARKTDRLTHPLEVIHNMYFKVLARPADPAALSSLEPLVAGGRLPVAELEATLAGSEEAQFAQQYPSYLLPWRNHPPLARPSVVPAQDAAPAPNVIGWRQIGRYVGRRVRAYLA
jgi:predicted SAM-dependent methyltransferase